jgi:hypothetical protein
MDLLGHAAIECVTQFTHTGSTRIVASLSQIRVYYDWCPQIPSATMVAFLVTIRPFHWGGDDESAPLL